MVDTPALGAGAFGRGGSSPLSRTKLKYDLFGRILICFRRQST